MGTNDLTIEQAIRLYKALSSSGGDVVSDGPYHVGDCVLIRTVTMMQVGRIVAIYPGEIVLDEAAWVADSGRFSAALETGVLEEVEVVRGPVIVGRGAIVDVYQWRHQLPKVTK